MPETSFDAGAVRGEIQAQIAEVLAKKKVKVDPADIVEGVSLTTQLGVDSLDILQLTASLEKRYGVRIPEEDLRKMDDLGSIMTSLAKHWPK